MPFSKKLLFIKQQQEEDDESSGGSSGSNIEFKDFTGLMGEAKRDDLLPPDEKRRLMLVAERVHKESVKKEQNKRQLMKDLKEDKINLNDFRQQTTQHNQYKVHPIASKFSGASPQVSFNPNESITQTNDELQNKLKNDYRLTHQLRQELRNDFNPKPRPY